MSVKRREFLLGGIAAAASPLVARAAAAIAPGEAGSLADAQVIWPAVSVPVPLRGNDPVPPDLHSVFVKEVHLSAAPTQARLHLFAFTRYRLYVNGRYIGRGPCRYQNQRPEYDTRDLRGYLQPGRNTIAVLVHRDSPTGRIMRHDPGFAAALEVVVAGKKQRVVTNTSWLSMPERSFGPRGVAWSSIEEQIDARKERDWTQPDLALPVWQPSAVVPGAASIRFFPRSEPLQQESQRPWSPGAPSLPVGLAAGSELSFSLPGVAQAYHLLEMDAEEGSTLEVSYDVPEGGVSGTGIYVARAGVQTWMGGDTFAMLRLRVRVTAGRIRLLRAAAYEVRYPFERVAAFSCSDPFLNQLWTLCARSLEVLSEDSYVDCADRERVEWTDNSPPAFDCTRVMMRGPDDDGQAHWADARLLGGLLRRIALTQQPDGQLKAHSCSERFDIHAIMEDRSCDWVVQMRAYQESCGDTELVRELWPTLNRLFDWYRKRLTPRGLVLAREWEIWDNPLRYQVCEGAGLNAMYYRALVDASVLAGRIGKPSSAQSLAEEAQRLQIDVNRSLWNEQEGAYDGGLFGPGSEIRPQLDGPFTGKIVDGRFHPTAQGNLFALYSGIVPPDRIASVRQYIIRHLDEVRSPMSHYYLFQMLYAMNDAQQDGLVLERMRTGWKNQVDSEWQTSWEELDKGGGSRVHIYGMHPGYFLTAFVLGARRDGPASRRSIVIEPRFSGLDWAKGVCVTEFGPVPMEWRRNATRNVDIACTVPAQTRATLRLPVAENAGVLEIDGKTVSASRGQGGLEAKLPPGSHTIRFRS